MNQEQIGNFIAAMRKEKGLARAQLAEKKSAYVLLNPVFFRNQPQFNS